MVCSYSAFVVSLHVHPTVAYDDVAVACRRKAAQCQHVRHYTNQVLAVGGVLLVVGAFSGVRVSLGKSCWCELVV